MGSLLINGPIMVETLNEPSKEPFYPRISEKIRDVGLIFNGVLLVRIILLLLGFSSTSLLQVFFWVSNVLVLPFSFVPGSFRVGEYYFEAPSAFALIAWAFFFYLLSLFIDYVRFKNARNQL